MSQTATQRFTDMPEMLGCLGRVIRNKALLFDLCLVSKLCNAAVTPSLYYEMRIDDAVAATLLKDLEFSLSNPHLRYVQKLVFCVRRTSTSGSESSHGELVHSCNEAIRKLLQNVPDLKSFSWSYQPLYTDTFSVLHQFCPKLTSLSIDWPDEIEEQLGIALDSDWDHSDGLWDLRHLFSNAQHLPLFTGLNVLKLRNIHGDIANQRSDISKILLASPDLVGLSLSINSDTIFRLYHQSHSNDNQNFLENLCVDYATQGGEPLLLRSLCLGLSILPYQSTTDALSRLQSLENNETLDQEIASYISKLTDLSVLEEVSVHNGGRDDALELYLEEKSGIAWPTFNQSLCPTLKSLSFYLLNDETRTWLQSDNQHDNNRLSWESHNLTQLRIETSDDGMDSVFELLSPEVGTPDSELDVQVPSVLILEEQISLGYLESFLEKLLVCIYLKGLKFVIDPGYISSRNILGPSEFLDAVKGLTNLEQLYVATGIQEMDADETLKGDCVELAYQVATVSVKLRHLKIGPLAWRIWRSEGLVRLEALDKYEEDDLPLFHFRVSF